MATSKDAKLLRQTKFPVEFNQKVDMKKVNVEVMKKWIAGKISEILGNEDDVVIELCFNLLEESRYPDIKDLQIKLTGFLDKDTPKFCKELWNLCLSAQTNAQGVPKELLEAKKMELMQEKIESEKAAEVARKRKETDQARARNIDSIRQNERNERDMGAGRSSGRGGSNGKALARRPSRSPPQNSGRYAGTSPPRRREDSYRDRERVWRDRDSDRDRNRDRDFYAPRNRPDRYNDRRYARSPSPTRPPSPKRRRRTSSPSPARNRPPANSRREQPTRRDRARSRSRTRSPAARNTRKRSASSSSRSSSPPPRRARRRNTSSSISSARSRSKSRSRSPPAAQNEPRQTKTKDDTRASESRSRSRSRTPPRQERKKRQRSIERYAPAASRRRRHSSGSRSDGEEK